MFDHAAAAARAIPESAPAIHHANTRGEKLNGRPRLVEAEIAIAADIAAKIRLSEARSAVSAFDDVNPVDMPWRTMLEQRLSPVNVWPKTRLQAIHGNLGHASGRTCSSTIRAIS